jgi:hypothetical protein
VRLGDAELFLGAAELSGFAPASQLFFDGPMVIVASKDGVAISVERHWKAVARKQDAEQMGIAFGGLGGKESRRWDLSGGVVL